MAQSLPEQDRRVGSWRVFAGLFAISFIAFAGISQLVAPVDVGLNTASVLKQLVGHAVAYGVVFTVYFAIALILTAAYGKLAKSSWSHGWASIFTRALVPTAVISVIGIGLSSLASK
jgi:hypothetical protein